jgi:hypothetical protein
VSLIKEASGEGLSATAFTHYINIVIVCKINNDADSINEEVISSLVEEVKTCLSLSVDYMKTYEMIIMINISL